MTEGNDQQVVSPTLLSFAFPILINLPDRKDRLRDSLRELEKLAGEPVEAGVGFHLLRPPTFTDAGGFVNAGFRSCLHAHLEAARFARDHGLERVLILEDDIAFGSSWVRRQQQVLTDLEGFDWDIVNLGYLDGPGAPTANPEFSWERFTGEVIGCHAYLVTGAFLPHWIDHLEAIASGVPGDHLQGPMSPDGALNTITWLAPETRRFLANPSLVDQRASRSDINTRAIDRVRFLRPLIERIRRMRRG